MRATRTLAAIALLVVLLVAGCGRRDSAISAHLERASKLLDRHRPLQARAEIDKAIRTDPSRPATYIVSSFLLARHKRPADAIPILERLLEKSRSGKLDPELSKPERAEVLTMLGEAGLDTGDLPDADKAFREALALDQANPMVANNIAYLYADRGQRLDEALRLARRAVRRMPEGGIVLDTLGWVEYKLGRYPGAARTLAKAVKLEPDHATIRYHLGAAYVKLGRRQAARIELQKALLLDSGMNEAAKLLKLIHN